MSDASKIRDRIRQLRARTTARGCTEAEAMEAAAKAAEMMAAHGLIDGDIVFEELGSKTKHSPKSSRGQLWATVATCTSTAVFVSTKRDGLHVVFLGQAPGPEIAVYLREVCDRSIDKELAVFKAGTFYKRRRSIATKRDAAADFTDAMVARLRRRLMELFAASIETGGAARDAAGAEHDRRYPDSETVERRKRKERYGEAADAGYRAGSRPQLAHGVSGKGKAPLQIGRAS